jgi:branched-chain amino acid transport system permease protein
MMRYLPLVILLGLPLLFGDAYHQRFAAEVLIMATAVISLDLLIGFGGLVSLGHAAVFGTAAYAAALTAIHFGANLPLVLLAGVIASSLVAGLMALLARRSSGLFFLILTLVAGQIVWEVAFHWRDVTGAADGLRGIPPLALDLYVVGFDLSSSLALYLTAAVICLTGLLLARSFVDAPIGRALLGTREQPLRMQALGHDIGHIRLKTMLAAGVIAGMAGALYPFVNQYVGPNAVHWTLSAAMIIMLVIGGVGTLSGGLIGAIVYMTIQTYLSSYTDRWQLIIGAIFVATVIIVPHGLMPLLSSITRRFGRGEGEPQP